MTTVLAKDVDRRAWRHWAGPDTATPTGLHLLFGAGYLLFLVRLLVLLWVENSTTPWVILIKRLAELLWAPFWGVVVVSEFGNPYEFLLPAIILTLLSFGLIHLALTFSRPQHAEGIIMNKILTLFRAFFYLTATMFLLLVTLRLAVITYGELTRPKLGVINGVAPKK